MNGPPLASGGSRAGLFLPGPSAIPILEANRQLRGDSPKESGKMAKIYNLFISHSRSYQDAYDKLVGLLDSAGNFHYRNYSVPKNDPVHNAANVEALYKAIKTQMSFCQAVLIISGVYASYSKWIDREIRCASKDFSKPIIAIRPWGAGRTSRNVEEAATKTVAWNTASIVSAIREVAI